MGEFDAPATKAALEKIFGAWSTSEPYARVDAQFHARPGYRELIETPGKANAFLLGGIDLPIKDDDPSYPALRAADQIFGGSTLKSRLGDRLRQKDGLSYGTGTQLQGNSHVANSLIIAYAIFAPQNQPRVESDVKEELTRLLQDGITAGELSDAISGLLQAAAVGRANDGELAATLAGQLELGRTLLYTAEEEARLKALSVDDVNTAMRKYFDTDHIVQIYAGDFKTGKP